MIAWEVRVPLRILMIPRSFSLAAAGCAGADTIIKPAKEAGFELARALIFVRQVQGRERRAKRKILITHQAQNVDQERNKDMREAGVE